MNSSGTMSSLLERQVTRVVEVQQSAAVLKVPHLGIVQQQAVGNTPSPNIMMVNYGISMVMWLSTRLHNYVMMVHCHYWRK